MIQKIGWKHWQKVKKSLTADTHYSSTFSIENKYADIIQNEPVYNTYTEHMLIPNILVDDYA